MAVILSPPTSTVMSNCRALRRPPIRVTCSIAWLPAGPRWLRPGSRCTWRKQAEEELRRMRNVSGRHFVYSPVPIMLFDDREKVLAVSTSWLEASGYSREDLSTIEDWTARAYDEPQWTS
jgi:PAS domain-containing protein